MSYGLRRAGQVAEPFYVSPLRTYATRKAIRATKPIPRLSVAALELPRHVWLYIPASVAAITFDTPCYATTFDSRDIGSDEQDEFDAVAERTGMRCFFYRDQLEDIRANLILQRPDFTPEQLIAAIDFYWRHDAFIELPKNPT